MSVFIVSTILYHQAPRVSSRSTHILLCKGTNVYQAGGPRAKNKLLCYVSLQEIEICDISDFAPSNHLGSIYFVS